MQKPLLAAALGLALVSASSATPAQQTGRAYAGGAIGQSHVRFDDSVIEVPGAATQGVTQDEVETGYKAFAGYRFHRIAALEAGVVDFGRFRARNNASSGSAQLETKTRGWSLDVVGNWPISESFSLLGRLGGLFSYTNTTRSASGGATITPGLTQVKKSELTFHWGLGVSWDFARSMALRVEFEQAQNVGDQSTGEGNLSLLSAGLVLKF